MNDDSLRGDKTQMRTKIQTRGPSLSSQNNTTVQKIMIKIYHELHHEKQRIKREMKVKGQH